MTPRIGEEALRPLALPARIAALVDAYAPERGDRQEHFANLVGTNRWTVARWIRGQRPAPASAERIAQATGLPASLFASTRDSERAQIAEVQELRKEVGALREQVEQLARRVG